MLLNLGEKFRVITDPRNFVLQQLVTVTKKDTGLEANEWKDIGYFGRLEHALDKVLRVKLLESEATTAKQVLDEINSLKELIEKVVKKENILLNDYKLVKGGE